MRFFCAVSSNFLISVNATVFTADCVKGNDKLSRYRMTDDEIFAAAKQIKRNRRPDGGTAIRRRFFLFR